MLLKLENNNIKEGHSGYYTQGCHICWRSQDFGFQNIFLLSGFAKFEYILVTASSDSFFFLAMQTSVNSSLKVDLELNKYWLESWFFKKNFSKEA